MDAQQFQQLLQVLQQQQLQQQQAAAQQQQDFARALESIQHQVTLTTQTAQAASARASAAQTPAREQGHRQEIRSIIDPKVLERLERFSGKDEDFTEFETLFVAKCSLLGLEEHMADAVAAESDREVALDQQGEESLRVQSKALFFMLQEVCRGKSARIIKLAERFNGFHAWRLLKREYSPAVSTRFNAMLVGLLEPQFDDRSPFGDQLAAWLVSIAEYERDSGEAFHDRMKIAVLTARAPTSVST